jgi:hypothetical protein
VPPEKTDNADKPDKPDLDVKTNGSAADDPGRAIPAVNPRPDEDDDDEPAVDAKDRKRPKDKRTPPRKMSDDEVNAALNDVQDAINRGSVDEAKRLFKRVAESRPDHQRVKVFKNFAVLK